MSETSRKANSKKSDIIHKDPTARKLDEEKAEQLKRKKDIEFIDTKEYRRFEEFAKACEQYKYIGLCYGKPGVGKTLSAKHYAQWHKLQMIHKMEVLDSATQKAIAKSKGVFYSAKITDSPRAISDKIGRSMRDYGTAILRYQGVTDWEILLINTEQYCPLIIIDEADGLSFKALEQIRALYDEYQFGLILIGMPGFEKRLARYPQLFSRIGFAHEFKPLTSVEMEFIFEKQWEKLGLLLDKNQFADVEALKAIMRITNGNFRLIQRMFDQIIRLQKINMMDTITIDLVMAARDCLVMV